MRRVRAVVEDRIIFTCQPILGRGADLVGLSAADIQDHDYVCILFGCSVPVILRQDHNSEEVMRLRGEAYVHDHMEGEVFAGKTKEEMEQMTVDFKIR